MRRMTSRKEGGSRSHVMLLMVQVAVHYGVATISRMLKNICLFAEYRSLLQVSFAKETYIFKHPTNSSHPIPVDQTSRVMSLKAQTQSYSCPQTQLLLRVVVHMCTTTRNTCEISCCSCCVLLYTCQRSAATHCACCCTHVNAVLHHTVPHRRHKHINRGLLCRISSLLQGSFAKEAYVFREPTIRSHPIAHKKLQQAYRLLYRVYCDCESSLNLGLDKEE